MKNYNYSVVIIETDEDRKSFYMATGFKPPKGAAMVKGCFDGQECSQVMAMRKNGESYNDAISRVTQDEIDDETLFIKVGK